MMRLAPSRQRLPPRTPSAGSRRRLRQPSGASIDFLSGFSDGVASKCCGQIKTAACGLGGARLRVCRPRAGRENGRNPTATATCSAGHEQLVTAAQPLVTFDLYDRRDLDSKVVEVRGILVSRPKAAVVSLLAALLLIASLGVAVVFRPSAAPQLAVPTSAGLNYGMPPTDRGEWVGTQWLRPAYWDATRPALAADLDFIQRNSLGRVLRVFIGLDQLLVCNSQAGFDRLDEASVDHFNAALSMFAPHGIKIIPLP